MKLRHIPLFATTAICAALSVGFAGGAFASPRTQPTIEESPRVKFADLDLNTDHGARVMLQRLRSASYGVCGGLSDEAWEAYGDCREQAVRGVVAQLNAPRLTAAYLGKHHSSQVTVAD